MVKQIFAKLVVKTKLKVHSLDLFKFNGHYSSHSVQKRNNICSKFLTRTVIIQIFVTLGKNVFMKLLQVLKLNHYLSRGSIR